MFYSVFSGASMTEVTGNLVKNANWSEHIKLGSCRGVPYTVCRSRVIAESVFRVPCSVFRNIPYM